MSGSEPKTRREFVNGFVSGVIGGAAALVVMGAGVMTSGVKCEMAADAAELRLAAAWRLNRMAWWRASLEKQVTALIGKNEYGWEHRLMDQLVSDVKKDGFHCGFDYGTLTGARTNWESRLDEVHWAFCDDGYRSAYHPEWSVVREKTIAEEYGPQVGL